MRYLIGDLSGVFVEGYRGMDRYGGLCVSQPLTQALKEQIEVYNTCADEQDEAIMLELYREAVECGGEELDLIALDRAERHHSSAWRLLGYDMGEKNDEENLWSAINRHYYYAQWSFFRPWARYMNAHKLFSTRQAAHSFREYYLNESNDPVFEWSTREECETLYQVASVHLYQPKKKIVALPSKRYRGEAPRMAILQHQQR